MHSEQRDRRTLRDVLFQLVAGNPDNGAYSPYQTGNEGRAPVFALHQVGIAAIKERLDTRATPMARK